MAVLAAEDATRLFVARSRWRWEEIVFWLVAASSYFLFPGHLVLITQALIAGLFSMSLDILLGYAGIASMGHAAFFGLGAYTAGILAKMGYGDPILDLLAAAVLAGGFGALCSLLVARLHGIGMLMVTLGIGLSCYELANRWRDMTGGDDGLQGMVVKPIFGIFAFDFDGHVAFIYSFVVIFILYLFARRLVNSPFGLALLGIRENLRRVPALGIGVRAQLMLAFTIAASIAGVAGALLAESTQFIALEVLGFDRSISVLIMLVLGGIGNLVGGMIGAMVFTVARDELAALDPVYWNFWMGLILCAIVLSGSGGIVGLLRRIERRFGGTAR
ncbi:MAG TPA: branched-chain amino acid ABC transporter permease [Stellaceae bacterium]|nr:branched-chain amino acid ABC transporter permease [Stellaceae bacterium]